MKFARISLFVISWQFLFWLNCCVSTQSDTVRTIDNETASLDAVDIAVKQGGKDVTRASELILKRKDEKIVHEYLDKLINKSLSSISTNDAYSLSALYLRLPIALSLKSFEKFIDSEDTKKQEIGWHLAAMKPSRSIARFIEEKISKAIEKNQESNYFLPSAAHAILILKIQSLYTFLRQGLYEKGDSEYVEAMAQLNPTSAGKDFMDYLAIVPPEELRQLTLVTIQTMSCVKILSHLIKNPPLATHTGFATILAYVVSRNNAISDLAHELIYSYVPKNSEDIAYALTTKPLWMQIAFIESSNRKRDPKVNILLKELEEVSGNNEVLEELKTLL